MASAPHNGHPDYQVDDPQFGRIGGQWQMILGSERHKTFTIAVGRRVGKTTSRPFKWLRRAAQTPGFYRAGFIAQDHAKAYEMFRHTLEQWGGDPKVSKNTIVTEIAGDPKSQRRYIRAAPIAIERPKPGEPTNTGLEVWFWSGQHPHYEKIRGYMFHFNDIDVDEPALLHPNILNTINPMLADAGGHLCITGTPDVNQIGNSWFEAYFNKGLDPTEPDFGCMNVPMYAAPEVIQASDGSMVPFMTRESIEDFKRRCITDEAWLQEGMAEFLSGRGAVFSRIDSVFVLDPIPRPDWVNVMWGQVYDKPDSIGGEGVEIWVGANPEPGVRYVLGVDWARVRDSTVISVFSRETNEQVCLAVMRQEEYEEQVEWVSLLRQHYNKATIHSDQNGVGDSMTRTLQRRFHEGCVGHRFTASNKAGYVRDTQQLFNNVEVKMLNVEPQRGEFKAFMSEKSETTGRVSYKHPPEGNDDCVDAVLMIAETLRLGTRQRVVPVDNEPRWLSLDWLLKQRKGRARAARMGQHRL